MGICEFHYASMCVDLTYLVCPMLIPSSRNMQLRRYGFLFFVASSPLLDTMGMKDYFITSFCCGITVSHPRLGILTDCYLMLDNWRNGFYEFGKEDPQNGGRKIQSLRGSFFKNIPSKYPMRPWVDKLGLISTLNVSADT